MGYRAVQAALCRGHACVERRRGVFDVALQRREMALQLGRVAHEILAAVAQHKPLSGAHAPEPEPKPRAQQQRHDRDGSGCDRHDPGGRVQDPRGGEWLHRLEDMRQCQRVRLGVRLASRGGLAPGAPWAT